MEKTPLWQKAWFIMLMFFIVPPIGIVLMWYGKKEWNKVIKIVLSVIFGLYFFLWSLILLGIAAGEDTSASAPAETTAYSELTETHTTIIFETPTKEENTTTQTTVVEEPATVIPTTNKTTTTTPSVVTKPVATTKKVTTTAKPTTTKAPTTAKPTTTKAPTTAKPTTTKAPTTVNPDTRVTVYRTKSGEKYHYENPCGNGTYYAISLAEAKSAGLGPCEKCVLH